jgi:hypothetical protein
LRLTGIKGRHTSWLSTLAVASFGWRRVLFDGQGSAAVLIRSLRQLFYFHIETNERDNTAEHSPLSHGLN